MHEESTVVVLASVLPTAILMESLLYAVKGICMCRSVSDTTCLILFVVITKTLHKE